MIQLGDTVKDSISGFTGVVVCRNQWLYGCVRLGVQPKVDKDGRLPDMVNFDEPQLDVVKKAKAAKAGEAADEKFGPRNDPGRRSF